MTIGARLTGHYTRDNANDDVSLSLLPAAPDILNATGTLTVTKSAGARPPAPADASVQLSLTPTTTQGTIAYDSIDNGATRHYRLTLLPGTSLGVQRAVDGGRAVAHARGRLEDITDVNTPIVVVDSAPLTMTFTDGGTAAVDTLALTLHHENGGLWMAAGWNGITITEEALTTGSVVFGTEE
jgi:hypothetical protein